jgi:hypothetical protein
MCSSFCNEAMTLGAMAISNFDKGPSRHLLCSRSKSAGRYSKLSRQSSICDLYSPKMPLVWWCCSLMDERCCRGGSSTSFSVSEFPKGESDVVFVPHLPAHPILSLRTHLHLHHIHTTIHTRDANLHCNLTHRSTTTPLPSTERDGVRSSRQGSLRLCRAGSRWRALFQRRSDHLCGRQGG